MDNFRQIKILGNKTSWNFLKVDYVNVAKCTNNNTFIDIVLRCSVISYFVPDPHGVKKM